ncbi:MAG: hypothetical protein ACJ748_00095 [Flavisolibacter sp.]
MKEEKVGTVNVHVSYRSTGNIIRHKEVSMQVTKDNENVYKAIPELSLEERRLADVPDELRFEIKNGKGYSLRGLKEGNVDLINDIVRQLKEDSQT